MSPVNPGPMWLTFDTPSGNFHSEFNELPAPAIHGPGSHTTFRSPTRVLADGWQAGSFRASDPGVFPTMSSVWARIPGLSGDPLADGTSHCAARAVWLRPCGQNWRVRPDSWGRTVANWPVSVWTRLDPIGL